MFFKRKQKKVFVIGLDCASPRLLFNDFRNDLPNIGKMIAQGSSGPLRTIHPPITIPAWMSMVSGRDAGQMGVYGFRTRKPMSYKEFAISTSYAFRGIEMIWDVLAKHKKKSILVGIPPSYPVFPVEGSMVSGFICPDATREYTYPKELKNEIDALIGRYDFDVIFRTEERDQIIKSLWEMTNKRFKVIEYLMQKKPWDFFMFVEIGVDRVQHAFWKYYDAAHHLHVPNHKYKNVILDYYKLIDERIGRLMKMLDKDTTVFIVSDHGVKAMKGAFCINEWLIKKGYLTLRTYPESPASFDALDIDWQRSKVWGWGGYYGRIYINRKGREPSGIVDDAEYEPLRDELINALEKEADASGVQWKTRVYRPEGLYATANGSPPDLMAFFDDLNYRSAATVGHNSLFLTKNDTGPDDAMHDWDGVFVRYCAGENKKQEQVKKSILGFKSEVLEVFNIS